MPSPQRELLPLHPHPATTMSRPSSYPSTTTLALPLCGNPTTKAHHSSHHPDIDTASTHTSTSLPTSQQRGHGPPFPPLLVLTTMTPTTRRQHSDAVLSPALRGVTEATVCSSAHSTISGARNFCALDRRSVVHSGSNSFAARGRIPVGVGLSFHQGNTNPHH